MLSLKPAPVNTDLLRRVPVFAHLPEVKLEWMIAQGKAVKVAPGGLLRAEGEPANCVFVLLEGTCRMTQRSGNQDILLVQHDRPTLIGEVPLLMGVPYFWASGRAVTTCHILELNADTFWQFVGLCPTVAKSVLQTMIVRMQEIQVLAQHRERLISLGTLAAGLAHELNNPASAARRAARELRKVFPLMQTQTLKLTHKCLTDEQREFLTNLQQEAIALAQNPPLLDPMVQSDREDQLTAWMDDHNVQNGWQFASTFVNAGLDCDWLEQILTHLSEVCLQDSLTWLDATLNVVGLLNTLGHSTGRIHQLVGAVQDYSKVDPDNLQLVDIHKGLESTLTILGHKLKHGVTVIRDYAEDLPTVMSHDAELEQVWMNVIDNAIAATLERFNQNTSSASPVSSTPSLHTNPVMIPTGWQNRARHLSTTNQPTIWIHTRCEADWILVEIADNGIGIPPEVQPHIYEPFFTTKGIGKGTGLGLNTSYKIIKRHGGDIRVTSQPGDTCFQIRFPSQC